MFRFITTNNYSSFFENPSENFFYERVSSEFSSRNSTWYITNPIAYVYAFENIDQTFFYVNLIFFIYTINVKKKLIYFVWESFFYIYFLHETSFFTITAYGQITFRKNGVLKLYFIYFNTYASRTYYLLLW